MLLSDREKQLRAHFKAGMLQREHTVFQFRFTEGKDFYLTVYPDSFEFTEGHSPDPTLNLYLDCQDTCWQLLAGTMDGMEAFMEGRYRADGNIILSQLLLYLFQSDDPTLVFKVQD